jgi:hypothetical protein
MVDTCEPPLAAMNVASERQCKRGPRRNRRAKLWKHPLKPHVEMPYQVAATVAVMQMGIAEYSVIAEAVGLTVEEVGQIDAATDPSVRELAATGVPCGEYFKLDRRVRCPKCRVLVRLAPCIACLCSQESLTGFARVPPA